MTCQRCQDEATVHLTETVDGQRRKLDLCASCAREAGVALPEKPPPLALDAVVQTLIVAHVGELVGEMADLTCPDCRLKFMEFRARGRLGCPHDYQVFMRGLLPLLQRVHGATRHVGKIARRRPEVSERLRLRSRLREAIVREDYELAVTLRDQLRLRGQDA
jgi:protein arginine kinase activator